MRKLSIVALVVAAVCSGAANASVIKVEGASGTTSFLSSGNAYLAAVNAALAGPSYHFVNAGSLDSFSHASLFGPNSNFAIKSTVNFGVTDANAGNYMIRAGVDLGRGGAMFLDGVAVDFHGNNMWWSGSYTNPSQYFAATRFLAGGNHVLQVLGFEDCCDGGSQIQFMKSGAARFTSFASSDGMNKIPEPASASLVLAGVGLLALSRRRKARQA